MQARAFSPPQQAPACSAARAVVCRVSGWPSRRGRAGAARAQGDSTNRRGTKDGSASSSEDDTGGSRLTRADGGGRPESQEHGRRRKDSGRGCPARPAPPGPTQKQMLKEVLQRMGGVGKRMGRLERGVKRIQAEQATQSRSIKAIQAEQATQSRIIKSIQAEQATQGQTHDALAEMAWRLRAALTTDLGLWPPVTIRWASSPPCLARMRAPCSGRWCMATLASMPCGA